MQAIRSMKGLYFYDCFEYSPRMGSAMVCMMRKKCKCSFFFMSYAFREIFPFIIVPNQYMFCIRTHLNQDIDVSIVHLV